MYKEKNNDNNISIHYANLKGTIKSLQTKLSATFVSIHNHTNNQQRRKRNEGNKEEQLSHFWWEYHFDFKLLEIRLCMKNIL